MRFDIITLFPQLFGPMLDSGVTRRAFESGQVQVRLWDLREQGEGPYRRVDDRPYGGGPGMVMMAEPLWQCLQRIRADRPKAAPVLLFSPLGQALDHAAVSHWAGSDGAILICGRYEGLDQRFIDAYVDAQISLGDFILSGGEIAAMALLDAVARLQPGVLHDEGSHQQDSFNPLQDGLLDCPHYSRPEVWRGQAVPAALTSGHHAQIALWRRQQSLLLSARHRPDLIDRARSRGQLSPTDLSFLQGLGPEGDQAAGSLPSAARDPRAG